MVHSHLGQVDNPNASEAILRSQRLSYLYRGITTRIGTDSDKRRCSDLIIQWDAIHTVQVGNIRFYADSMLLYLARGTRAAPMLRSALQPRFHASC